MVHMDSSPHPAPLRQRENLWVSTLITSLGNFGVQMNYQAIAIALIVMTAEVCTLDDDSECKEGEQEAWVTSTLTATVFAGSILGQLTMGYAGDLLGRDFAMIFTLSIAAFSAIASAVLPQGDPHSVYTILLTCRFLLGIGVGGVYPLSATKAAEDAAYGEGGKTNNRSAARSFFWQAPGSMVPWLLALVVVPTAMSTSMEWRFLLGVGAIPVLMAIGLCFYELHLKGLKNLEKTDSKDMIPKPVIHVAPSVFVLLSDPVMIKKLIGTGGAWFIFDVCYYGVGLFGGQILASLKTTDDDDITSDKSIVLISWQQAVALGCGIPAYLASNYCIKHWGMKRTQTAGFIITSVCFVVMAVSFYPLKENSPATLYFFYCLLLFSLCFGPNVTTYVLPASVYDKEVRATMNGVSAACGKSGAVVGAYFFGAVASVIGYPAVMCMCAALSLVGALVTQKYIADGLDDDSHLKKGLLDLEEDSNSEEDAENKGSSTKVVL
jgi:PHS family inorganic phosphate transporter-like MFS transporter